MLGSIAAFYAVMAPYTKVEESFNVQVPTSAPSLFASPHCVEIWPQYRCRISIVCSIGCLHVLSFSGGRSPPPPLLACLILDATAVAPVPLLRRLIPAHPDLLGCLYP